MHVQHAPGSPEHGVAFDLEAIARELTSQEPYRREGLAARTLIRTSALRVVLVALEAGKAIAEHRTKAAASVQALSGKIRVQLPDRGVDVTAGQLLVLGSGLSHDVRAETDSAFVLTLGWPAPA
jgi:quercetin dioxygenase-like cupin family protein